MTYRPVFLMFILIAGVFSVRAQPSYTQKFLPALAPSSPEAAAFDKYGHYEVNMFTGVPSISIPIYEIKVGELSVPISISYHAAGIKVNDMPSRVGLGWDLQAGGSITRRVMGRADEKDGNYLSQTTTSAGRVKNSGEIDPFSADGLNYLMWASDGTYDVEPDIFSYNFPGHSGKFLFNQKNSYAPVFIPYAPVSVAYSKPTSNTLALSMADENGINYNFGTTETMSSGTGVLTSAMSAWLLSDMTSANSQDNIHFVYSARQGAGITDSYFSDYCIVTSNCSGSYTPDPGSYYSNRVDVSTIWQQLNEIDFPNGKVVFEAGTDTRLDFNQAYQLQSRLNAIKIYSYNPKNTTYSLLRTIKFFQSYFINGTDAATKRLKLDSIQFTSSGGTVVQTYSFVYNTSVSLPNNLSKMKDYWGYFNNFDNRTSLNVATMVPRMQVPYPSTADPTATVWIGGTTAGGRDPSTYYMQADILQQINYPTGGFTQFEYETNQYLDDQGNPKYAGGLRIKSIKSYTASGATPLVKTYKYGKNESGYGRNNFALANYFFSSSQSVRIAGQIVSGSCTSISSKNVSTYFGNPTNDMEGYDGAAVVYDTVAEYNGDATTNSGKTVCLFSDHADVETDMIGYGKPIFNSYHFVRGLLTNKSDYRRNSDGSYTLVAESRKKYQYFPIQSTSNGLGLVVYKFLLNEDGSGLNFGNSCNTFTDSYSYRYNFYDLLTGDNKLIADTAITYDQSDPTKYSLKATTYVYDDVTHLGLKKTQTANSKKETITTAYTYPYNFGTSPYTSMTTAHIFNKVVSDTTTNSVTGQLSQKTNTYAAFSGNNYLVSNIQLKIKSNPAETRAYFNQYDTRGNILEMQKANDAKQSFIWDYKKISPIAVVDNAAQTDIAFTSFEGDGNGNWTFSGPAYLDVTAPTGKYTYSLGMGSITRAVTSTTSYIVSYWRPSASSALSITGTQSGYPKTGATIHGWTYYEHLVTGVSTLTLSGTGYIDEVRLYPAGALMTTYVYDPLVGLRSVCDPSSRITYYEFDDFQRLMLVRDQDKNVLKKISYDYYNQAETPTVYFSSQYSQAFTRSCSAGYIGSSVTYTVPANLYTGMDQASANQKATDDLSGNGQAYANANGTCTLGVTIQGSNSKTASYNLKFTKSTGEVFNFVLNASTPTLSTLGYVLPGVYTVQFYPQGAPITATYKINTLTTSGTGATFNNVSITATSQAQMY